MDVIFPTGISDGTPATDDRILFSDTSASNATKDCAISALPISDATTTALGLKVDKTTTVNGHALSGNVTVTASDVGLGNVDNTTDLNKPISTATQTALNAKQGTITLTTTGSSGASTLIGDVLNIPEYLPGTGDVVGPASATDNAVVRFDTTTGKLIQDSAVTIADTTGDITAGKYNTVAISGSATPTLSVTGTTTVSGVNTGDQTNITGNAGTVTNGVYTTDAGTVFLAPNGSAAALTSFPTLNQNTTGTSSNVTGIVAIANGGTGQTTAQLAINALTAVAAATNEYVLTKDTASGNALWKVAAGGGSFTWGATATGTSGTGLTLTVGNSASASTIAQSITIGNTQTNNATGLRVYSSTSGTGSGSNIINGVEIDCSSDIQTIQGGGASLLLNCYSTGQAAYKNQGLTIGINANTNSTSSFNAINVYNENNAGTGYNNGVSITNRSTEHNGSGAGDGLFIRQSGVGGTAFFILSDNNINSSTNGLANITLSNTQSGASILSKLDTGTSTQAHIGQLINLYNVSTSAVGLSIVGSTTGNGKAINISGGALSYGIYQNELLNSSNNSYSPFYFSTGLSGSLSNRTSVNFATLNHSRENTATSGTISDSYSMLRISRQSTQNGAGGTFILTGSVLDVSNVSSQTAGTITDSISVIKVTQSDISTGAGIYLSTTGTGRKALKFDTGFTTTTAPTGATKYIIVDIGGTEYKIIAQAT